MDQNGDIAADLNIMSWVVLPDGDLTEEKFGVFERKKLIINTDALAWLKLLNKV